MVKVATADAAKIDAGKTRIDQGGRQEARRDGRRGGQAGGSRHGRGLGAGAPAQPPAPAQSDAQGGPIDFLGRVGAGGGDIVKSWFHIGGADVPANSAPAFEPSAPIPSNVPLPPRRDTTAEASPGKMVRFAALHVAAEKGKPLDINAAAAPAQQ